MALKPPNTGVPLSLLILQNLPFPSLLRDLLSVQVLSFIMVPDLGKLSQGHQQPDIDIDLE